MVSRIVPGATFRPVRFGDATGTLTSPLGWILHVAVMNGSPWHVFDGSQHPSRKVSTGWVAKDGRVEQYIDRDARPWAQAAGNPRYRAWETEGYPNEPLTTAQIDALARIHIWDGAPDHLANHPDETGIGTHYMGGAAWGGHTCPDPAPGGQGPRSHQRAAILARVAELRGHPAPSPRPVPTPTRPPAFPLPAGWYFGPASGPAQSVSGYHGYGAQLAQWQTQMAHRGWTITVDGHYGPQTASTTRTFQTQKNLQVDGLIGHGTWDAAWCLPLTSSRP
jgi:peptidoglycan hydrolase-like protein with peptidoglycan-binding domain